MKLNAMTIAERGASGSAATTYLRYGEIYLHSGEDITTGFPYFTQPLVESRTQFVATPSLHYYLPVSSHFYGYFDNLFYNFREPVLMNPVTNATPLEEQILAKMDKRIVTTLKKYLHLTPAQGTIRTHPITSRTSLS